MIKIVKFDLKNKIKRDDVLNTHWFEINATATKILLRQRICIHVYHQFQVFFYLVKHFFYINVKEYVKKGI